MATSSPFVKFSQEKLYFPLPLSLSSVTENSLTVENKLQTQEGTLVYKVLCSAAHRYIVSAPVGIIKPGSSITLKVVLEKAFIESTIAAGGGGETSSGAGDGTQSSSALDKSSIYNKAAKHELHFFFCPVPEGTTIKTVEEASTFWKLEKNLPGKKKKERGGDGAAEEEEDGSSSGIHQKDRTSAGKSAEGRGGEGAATNSSSPEKDVKKKIFCVRIPCVFLPREEIPSSVQLIDRPVKKESKTSTSQKTGKGGKRDRTIISPQSEKSRLSRSVKVQTPQEQAVAEARAQWSVKTEEKKKGNAINRCLSIKIPRYMAFLFLFLAFLGGLKETNTTLSRRIAGH